MKINLNKISYLFFLQSFLITATPSVSYDFSGGRFGDNVIAYLHAKWISFKYNIPLIYKPFTHSDKLVLSQEENLTDFSQLTCKKLSKTNPCPDLTDDDSCVYIVPYFAEAVYEHDFFKSWIYFKVEWKNPEFKKIIQRLVKPIDENLLTSHDLPKDRITLAVHVRKGGGFDGPLLSEATENIDKNLSRYTDYFFLPKFPPDFFYSDQIKKISELFNHQPIYIYVFTDDQNPARIVEKLQANLYEYTNIEFDYRKKGNHHKSNILEDFFALTQFDCLIRGQSNFSICAGKIANYAIEIAPTKFHWEGTQPFIDEVEITIDQDRLESIKFRSS